MSLLRDVLITAGDALRFSSDLMRYKFDAQTKALKRSMGRLAFCLALYAAAVLLLGTGVGFILYGLFMHIAFTWGSVPAGLIIGVAVSLIAVLLLLIGRILMRRA
ncbi:MAG: hypothetical protein A2Y77_14150 [Planctomycetes bacterium RBG_13_62_9]|nr:MAG: hypothetical protein A2Y77_14150 [Planctomycetes bacterium RBG_13_62_9]